MRIEKSCGGVVFTRQGREMFFVVIRQTNGDYGFPKGHMEPGEDEQTTALREIREETGVEAYILDGFRREIIYPFPNRPDVMKQCVYFLAEYSDQELLCQPEEVCEILLLSYAQAMEKLSFAETKAILAEARKCLK